MFESKLDSIEYQINLYYKQFYHQSFRIKNEVRKLLSKEIEKKHIAEIIDIYHLRGENNRMVQMEINSEEMHTTGPPYISVPARTVEIIITNNARFNIEYICNGKKELLMDIKNNLTLKGFFKEIPKFKKFLVNKI